MQKPRLFHKLPSFCSAIVLFKFLDVHPTHQIQWNRRVARDSQIYTAVPENSVVFQRVDRSVGLGKDGIQEAMSFH